MRSPHCLVSAAVIALGLAACTKEESTTPSEQPSERQITIIASTESCVDTKTSLSGNDTDGYKVLWSTGDKITLVKGSNLYEFTLADGVGTTTGSFTGPRLDNGEYQAFYGTDGEELSGLYDYKGINMISSAPMVADVTITDGVTSVARFRNLCGLLRLTLKGCGTVKEIKVHASQPLNGHLSIDEEQGYAHVHAFGQDNYDNTLFCGDGVALTDEGIDFLIPMPQNEYDGIRIEITDDTEYKCTKTLKAGKKLNIARAQITPVRLTFTKPVIPDGALSGEFKVNDSDKKVYFSKGNMYCYTGGPYRPNFEFEENQYSFAEAWDMNHVSHFYWDGHEEHSYTYLPADTHSGNGVLFTNDSDDDEKPNSIFAANDLFGTYRTLSKDEWKYLFEHHQHRRVTVNGIGGCVIAPYGTALASDKTSFTTSELNDGHLVFLPVAGSRYAGTYLESEIGYGYYWSSSAADDGYSYCVCIDGNEVCLVKKHIDSGCCIRLVTDMDYEAPLVSSDIEKPEDSDNYDWK